MQTREIDPVEDPLTLADPVSPFAWLRRGDGIVAVGRDAVVEIREPAVDPSEPALEPHEGSPGLGETAPSPGLRSERLARRWRALAEKASVDDAVLLPGTGLVAFGALVFAEDSAASSVLRVPRTIMGRHRGRGWITRIRTDGDSAEDVVEPIAYGTAWSAALGPGAQTAGGYQESVRGALARIAAGEAEKIVLARDLRGALPSDADLRRLLRTLATGYPDTWAFAVDGLIGASPETLVTVRDGTLTARVLAGTVARGADADADTAASAALAGSEKDLDEHRFAVQSVLTALRPHVRTLAAADAPFILKLPNVFHLATDVEGDVAHRASVLDLIGALHPTAAVAGTPTPDALAAIAELEPFDRGRYAGPVGWVDGRGNGEWAIALRCAQIDPVPAEADAMPEQAGSAPEESGSTPQGTGGASEEPPRLTRRLTAYAGAGIVAGSDPETELLETRVKFRPIVDALA